MNKQTVGYSESIEIFNQSTGLKRWIKIYYDKEINEDQDPHQAFNEVKSFVENKFHKDNNPPPPAAGWLTTFQEGHGLQSAPIPEQQIEKPYTDENRVQNIIGDIESCKDIKVLESYKFIAKSHPYLQQVYETKLQSLQK